MKMISALQFACLILLISCSHDSDESTPDTVIPDAVLDESGIAMVSVEEHISQIILTTQKVIGNKWNDCGEVSVAKDENGLIYSIQFDGSKCSDGDVRAGKIIIEVNPQTNDVLTWPDNFSVNGRKVEGNFSFQTIPESQDEFRLVILNGRLSGAGEKVITYTGDERYRWLSEVDIEITAGRYSVILQDNGFIGADVKSSLLIRTECKERSSIPVKGILNIETSSDKSLIDFGNGDCDDAPSQSNKSGE